MKKTVVSILILLSLSGRELYAQKGKGSPKKGEAYFTQAEKEFYNLRYMYAISFYRAALKERVVKDDSLALLHISESYWQVKAYDSAWVYYQRFEKKYGPQFFTSQRLGELAASRQKYADAAAIYQRIQESYPGKYPAWVAQRLHGFLNPEAYLKDSVDYSIGFLKLNTRQQDFSPVYYKGGMVFVSSRYSKNNSSNEFGWDALPFVNIYRVSDTADLVTTDSLPRRMLYAYNRSIKANDDYTAKTSNDNDIILISKMRHPGKDEYRNLEKFSDELNSKYNYGPLCFNQNGDKVYFTRNALKAYKGKYNLEICEATLKNGAWTNSKVMPFVKPGYDYYHPAISAGDKRLYFCSDKPGGIGGSDIYYVSLENDSLKAIPVLLDSSVNTTGNELFPVFDADTLYYSSNGLAGLGGLDIYKTYPEKDGWKTPVNLGYPINSSYDDFSIIYNAEKTKGYFSSNRLGSDDIFTFSSNLNYLTLSGTVLHKITKRRLDSVNVHITEITREKAAKDSSITSFTGNFRFPVKAHHAYFLHFTRDGFTEDSLIVNKSAVEKEDIQLPLVYLAPFAPAPVVTAKAADNEKDSDGDGVVDSKDKCPDEKGLKENFGCPDIQSRLNELAKMVYFKTASAELSPAAIKPLNEAVIILLQYPNTTLAIEGHTDSRSGKAYNQDLSERRANSVKNYLINNGIKASRFTSVVGYGLTRPVADNNTEEGRALNRRVSIQATFVY